LVFLCAALWCGRHAMPFAVVSVGRESREGLWAVGEEGPTAAEWVLDLFGLSSSSKFKSSSSSSNANDSEVVPVRWRSVQGVLVRVACEAFAGRGDVREAVMGDLRAAYDVHPVSYSRDAAEGSEVADRERMKDTIFVPDARVMNANGTCVARPGAGSPGGARLQKIRDGWKEADAMAPPSPSPNGVRDLPRKGGGGGKGVWGVCEPLAVNMAPAPERVSAATSVEEILVALFDRLEELGFRLASGSHAAVVDGGGGKYVFHMSAEKAERLGLCAPGAGEVKARLAAKAKAADEAVEITADVNVDRRAEQVPENEESVVSHDSDNSEEISPTASEIAGEMGSETVPLELGQQHEEEAVEVAVDGPTAQLPTVTLQHLRSPAPRISPSFAAFRNDTSSGMSGYETEDDVPVVAGIPVESPGVYSGECTDPGPMHEEKTPEDPRETVEESNETAEDQAQPELPAEEEQETFASLVNDSENVDPNVGRESGPAQWQGKSKGKRKPRGCRGGKQKPKIQSKTPQLLPSPQATLRSPLGLVR